MKHKTYQLNLTATLFCLIAVTHIACAQDCKTNEELGMLPGEYIDAAHCEWPAARANWFNELKTEANKTLANKILTQIESVEKDSRKDFTLNGAVLKSTFSGDATGYISSKYAMAAYSMNLGVYEYFCARNKITVNTEYENVFRAYVNRFKDLTPAFNNLDDNAYCATPGQYDDRYISLHDFLRFKDKKILDAMNAGIGFYQDVPDDKVKQGNRNGYITRHWYITKSGTPLFVPVTRKEYLEALLEFYERELTLIKRNVADLDKDYQKNIKNAKGNEQSIAITNKSYNNHLVKYANYQSKYEAKKALVNTALKENKEAWLAAPAVVCPKPVTSWMYDKNLGWSDNGQGVADSEADGIKTGSFTFSGFWDDRSGDVLYKYNPAYFKNSAAGPAKPQMIELSFRYVKIPVGQRLVENFTKNFDFKAVAKILE